jgi:hypothetical protein
VEFSPPLAHAHERDYALGENPVCGAYLCIRSPHLTGQMAWLLQMFVSPPRSYKPYLKNGLLKTGFILIDIPGFVAAGRATKGRRTRRMLESVRMLVGAARSDTAQSHAMVFGWLKSLWRHESESMPHTTPTFVIGLIVMPIGTTFARFSDSRLRIADISKFRYVLYGVTAEVQLFFSVLLT